MIIIYTYNLLNEEEYDIDGPPGIGNSICTRKNPINEYQRNNRNTFLFKSTINDYSTPFAEVLASIIGKKTIENVCNCELTKKPNDFTKKHYTYGISSYYYYSNNDTIILPYYFISQFLKKQNLSLDPVYKNRIDIDICLHSIFDYMSTQNRPYQEYEHVKQQFIDMLIFDCKFGNDDREIENWMLYQDKTTGVIELYPLFDHEIFLGIGDSLDYLNLSDEEKSTLSSEEQLQLKKDRINKYNLDLKMKTITPQDYQKNYSSYTDILDFLLAKYPKETLKSCEKINSFAFSDLETLLDEFPDLPQKYKSVAKLNFIDRTLCINKTINNFKAKQNNQYSK